jgi:hypothetical protein
MSKLSLGALKERAEAVASEDLLASINGGTANSCHNFNPIQAMGEANAAGKEGIGNDGLTRWFLGLFGLSY